MSIVNRTSVLRVIALEINEDGAVSKKQMRIDRDSQLENTLLKADYPDIRVATIDIPQQQLDQYQQAMVEHTLGKRIVYDGVEYSLVGASASAKSGKYYAVDTAHAKAIAQRFRFWPEAAMTYFGILVSPCKVCIEIPDARVVVVRDHELGTNDCRGWIRRSCFERLHLADRHFYQFRMSFENTQAKGSFKIMEDDVADALSVDFVIPRSSCKPEFRKSENVCPAPNAAGRITGQFSTGRVVIGIREISRELQFSSSYTLVEHAPLSSIETEIKPIAMAAVEKVKTAIASNDFTELFRILGMSEEVELLRSDETVTDPEHTSSEHTVVEAVLKADSTGYWVKHPFVNSHLQRTLARWAFKLCTAGGFTLPAFALSDDGYLVLHNGRIHSGSDWIPEWHAITSLSSDRMLVVRYPIRTKGDLLPTKALNASTTLALLVRHLDRQKCSMDSVAVTEIVDRQLRLEGTLTLHSETAKKNGGDYDFDWICVVEGTRFPLFVEDRFRHTPSGENTKNKQSKKESPWWNLPQVAYSAKGNAIGAITDLKTSCLAAGRPDLANRCAIELQKALDQLKWGVEPNQEEIGKIRQEVGTAPWLKLKRIRRVSDLPLQVPTAPTDRIGSLYNHVRKELYEFFADVRPLEDFRGAICGGTYDRDMLKEAGMISTVYAVNICLLSEKRHAYENAVAEAQSKLDAFPISKASASREAANERRALVRKRNQAQAALHFYEERSRQDLRNLINIVRKWAERKEDHALDWLTALWDIACKSRRWDQRENRRLNTRYAGRVQAPFATQFQLALHALSNPARRRRDSHHERRAGSRQSIECGGARERGRAGRHHLGTDRVRVAAADERPNRREVYLSGGWRRRSQRGAGPVKTMEQDVEITAGHVFYLVRAGIRPAMSHETASIQSPSAARIVETFRVRFAKACDAGVWKRLSMVVMEPANPFDVKARRQARQEAIILGTLVFTALGLAVYFNLNAIAR